MYLVVISSRCQHAGLIKRAGDGFRDVDAGTWSLLSFRMQSLQNNKSGGELVFI